MNCILTEPLLLATLGADVLAQQGMELDELLKLGVFLLIAVIGGILQRQQTKKKPSGQRPAPPTAPKPTARPLPGERETSRVPDLPSPEKYEPFPRRAPEPPVLARPQPRVEEPRPPVPTELRPPRTRTHPPAERERPPLAPRPARRAAEREPEEPRSRHRGRERTDRRARPAADLPPVPGVQVETTPGSPAAPVSWATPQRSAARVTALRAALADRDAIQSAIVLAEILGPPVALRP